MNPNRPSRNWKLDAVLSKAKCLGLDIRFPPKKFGPMHRQNRIFINSRKCQVMAAAAPVPGTYGESVLLNAPKSAWPEFVIYVTRPPWADKLGVLVIPTERINEAAGEMDLYCAARFAERWDLLGRGSTPDGTE